MDSTSFKSPWSRDGLKLFLLGFITLFLELALIRYLAGNIWNLGYFPNLVLIAVFMGMGTGFIFHGYVDEKISFIVFQAAAFLLLVLVSFVYFAHPKVPGFGETAAEIGGELFFTQLPSGAGGEHYLSILICFVLVILIFAFISQRTAKLFRLFKPLTAYSLDITGSCAGIVCFMLISLFMVPAYWWFVVFALVFPMVMDGGYKKRLLPLSIALAAGIFAFYQDANPVAYPDYEGDFQAWWSPYQKVEKIGDFVFVNGVRHQSLMDKQNIARWYGRPYAEALESMSGDDPYRNVLILGSGTGNDVEAALMAGASHVDAVEIDPVIAGLGEKYHPAGPYQDPKVNLVVDDGRAFLSTTNNKYDVISFALTDSVVKVSSMSQLRLENYLFTVEAVEKAYGLLTDSGQLVFYNFYRRPWLVEKMRDMIFAATGKLPRVSSSPLFRNRLTLLSLEKDRPRNSADASHRVKFEVPTDDWPFLYLKEKSIPSFYLKVMAGMIALVALLFVVIRIASPRGSSGIRGGSSIKLVFLLMGLAFLLLETKSVIQFSLLFGNTWLNNSLVFLAVLILVLGANWTAVLIEKPGYNMWAAYFLLIISSLGILVFPLETFLKLDSGFLRFAGASVLIFSPVYFANLIFSLTFREQEVAEHLFGWNLIGATMGGILEYTSMAMGYGFLAVLVAISYTAVIVLLIRLRGVDLTPADAGKAAP